MSKGSHRRPSAVSADQVAENWARALGRIAEQSAARGTSPSSGLYENNPRTLMGLPLVLDETMGDCIEIRAEGEYTGALTLKPG